MACGVGLIKIYQRIKTIFNENESVEYINLYLITAFSALLYFFHGIAFWMYAFEPFLLVTQVLGIFVCVAAFLVNRAHGPRVSAIIMIVLICFSINIWAFATDGGNAMRWYAILALCPIYFFSVLRLGDKVLCTALIIAAFISSSFIAYWNEPAVKMDNLEIYSAVTSVVILMSIALELILYKYVSDKRDSELKRMGTILDNIECGIVIVDAESHKLLDINPVAERIYGDSKDTLIGMKCHKLICPAEEGACPVKDMGLTIHRSERVLVNKDGDKIPVIKSVAKIRYNDRPAYLESFTEITDLKEAEKKLRLLEITEQANRAKSDFLSRMSHEMRTPMNAIIGMAKIAEGTDDVERLKYCLSRIDISSSHLLGIINDILDMSKIESGKFELVEVPFNIEDVLMKVKSIMTEQAEAKNIELDIKADFAGSQYTGDEMRLLQVVINLMSNAVKFTPNGGKVTLSASEENENENEDGDGHISVRFSVSDTGIGMTEEQRGRLFNAFEQADGSITRKYGGTGLGLVISKNIVEKMGGGIWVESELGKGSTFTFTVKLERTCKQCAPPPAAQLEMPDFSDVTILLAEDVEINREIFAALLEDTNIKIECAENGLEAVQKFEASPYLYSAIIMDIQMPLMNGYEATEAIRALGTENARTIPIVALTANAFKEDIDKCLESGMNGHLKKPIELEAVIETLSFYCGA